LHSFRAGREVGEVRGDPLGRRALFSTVEPPPVGRGVPRAAGTMRKEALCSASEGERRLGTLVVECSSCGARSRLSWAEFAWRHLPVWLWFPWLRYSRYMSCPACERRTWLSVAWLS
jgi:hypothetical protein